MVGNGQVSSGSAWGKKWFLWILWWTSALWNVRVPWPS